MTASTVVAATEVPGPAGGAAFARPPESLNTRVVRSSAVLGVSAGLVATVSYACMLVLAALLPESDFIDFAACQSLLTVVGVAASSMIPLPLSQAVRAHPPASPERRRAVSFALAVSLGVGLVSAVVLASVAAGFSTAEVAVSTGVGALVLCCVMPVWGWLQGTARFRTYAGLRVAEAAARLFVTLCAGLLGWGVTGSVGGFAAGALVVLAVGLLLMRRELTVSPAALTDRGRWSDTGSIALVVCLLIGLAGADVVMMAVAGADSAQAAGYQAMSVLTKGPIYLATGTVLVVFPMMRNAAADEQDRIAQAAIRSYLRTGLFACVLLVTVPVGLLLLVLPAAYAASAPLLAWLAVAGAGFGLINVAAMILLATRRTRRLAAGVGTAVVAVPVAMLVGLHEGGPVGLAVGTASGAVLSALVLALLTREILPRGAGRAAGAAFAGFAVLLLLLFVVRPWPSAWLAVGVLAGLVVLDAVPKAFAVPTVDRLPGGRLRILHLGFEDAAMPGSGGGSQRTHEIDRRLASAGHQVTVLTTRFPGARDGVREGVDYRHVGFGRGATRLTRTLGYLLALPLTVRRRPADVVIEDFFAPISTMAARAWTGRPTVAVVQWLNAREKAGQYKVPVHLVERFGVRRHRDFIPMSQGVADRLLAVNPTARIRVIGNGVDPAAFDVCRIRGDDVVFVGRLEIQQKGVDLLLRAWAVAAGRIPGDLVIAGTGPDEQRLRRMADRLGVEERVRFAGWTAGPEKLALLARARVVAVPSRFETFGIVAAEAQATGAPVLAFDIDCLREVIGPDGGHVVPAFDTEEYGNALVRMWHRPEFEPETLSRRRFARRFDWDSLAGRQAAVLTEVADGIDVRTHSELVRSQLNGLGRRRSRGRRPARVLLIGNVGNGNTGDEALLAVALAGLDADCERTVLSRDPAAVGAVHGVPAASMSPVAAVRQLLRADALVVVGGGMFGPGLPRLVRLLPAFVSMGRILRSDAVYLGIGVYPGTPPGTLRRLRAAARRGAMSVRDRMSLRTLDLADDSPPCVGDLARMLEPVDRAGSRRALREAGIDIQRPLLIISAKATDSAEQSGELVDMLAAATRRWAAHGGSVAAIALSDRVDHGRVGGTDVAMARQVAALAGVEIPVIGPNLPPALARGIVGEAAAVVGLRFHAMVFALSAGRPCCGPDWEPKTAALLTEHDVPTMRDSAHLVTWLDELAHEVMPEEPAGRSVGPASTGLP